MKISPGYKFALIATVAMLLVVYVGGFIYDCFRKEKGPEFWQWVAPIGCFLIAGFWGWVAYRAMVTGRVGVSLAAIFFALMALVYAWVAKETRDRF